MRKLIVSNFVTLDGCYEGKDKNMNSIFDYYHETTMAMKTSITIIQNGCVPPIPCC